MHPGEVDCCSDVRTGRASSDEVRAAIEPRVPQPAALVETPVTRFEHIPVESTRQLGDIHCSSLSLANEMSCDGTRSDRPQNPYGLGRRHGETRPHAWPAHAVGSLRPSGFGTDDRRQAARRSIPRDGSVRSFDTRWNRRPMCLWFLRFGRCPTMRGCSLLQRPRWKVESMRSSARPHSMRALCGSPQSAGDRTGASG
jgi:hypothetical protein